MDATTTADSLPPPRREVRLTKKAFLDLAIWMGGFGILVGVVFPYMAVLVGTPAQRALSLEFFCTSMTAGVVVGVVNFGLARYVVGARISDLSMRMRYVGQALLNASKTGDWSNCSADTCQIAVTSEDELGEVAASFNSLLSALEMTQQLERSTATVTHALSERLELAGLVETTLDQYLAQTGATGGCVLVSREGELSVAESRNVECSEMALSSLVVQAQRSRLVHNIEVPEDLSIEAAVVSFRPRQVVMVPIWLGNTLLGAVLLASGTKLGENALRLLESFQAPTAVALNNALTHERFQRLAAIDPLTDAYNRRFGINRLAEELSRARRTVTALGILSFDIDHFKLVNDNHGHLAGDRVLRAVAGAARSVIRTGDVLIRTGGEEFLVVLPGAAGKDVRAIGEAIRKAVGASKVLAGQGEVSVTVSLGGVFYPGIGDDTPEELMAAADEALYESKHLGRDRLTIHASVALTGS
ncbi:MAG: diguanylate cyclase [Actinomycetota bacterium]|nr:diguanylate cyclase [Actinomycetota bacterium]